MNVAILYAGLSGYISACFKALKDTTGFNIMVVHWPVAEEAPFRDTFDSSIDEIYDKSQFSREELYVKLCKFEPDIVLVSGWMDSDYLNICRRIRKKGILVVGSSDTQYNGSFRQKIGKIISPWHLHNAIDIMWVTGERQKQLAYSLGYKGNKCWEGFYTCDWEAFSQPNRDYCSKKFLYIGRLIERKGLDTLVEAYGRYRETTDDPWELWIAGTGPMQVYLKGREGIVYKGFVQPEDLPELYSQVGAFVLPSRVEPWGVVIHEAAAAGLPIICSDACGAGVHLVRDHYNGFVFEAGQFGQLCHKLHQITNMSMAELQTMSRNSHTLSKQYTPKLWAKKIEEGVKLLSCERTT